MWLDKEQKVCEECNIILNEGEVWYDGDGRSLCAIHWEENRLAELRKEYAQRLQIKKGKD